MADTRTRICGAARAIFVSEGVDGISMRRVAADVGISPTAVYRHFNGKAALLAAVVEEGFSILEAGMRRARRAGTAREALLRLLECYVDFAVKHPQYFDFMFVLPRADARRYPDDFQRRESATFNILMDLVAKAMERGELRSDDVLETSLTIWSHAHGLACLHRSGRFGDHPRRLRAAFRRSMQRLLLGLAQ